MPNTTATQVATTMTDAEAIQIARAWVATRKEVRRHLIDLAREVTPWTNESWDDNTVRKLYHYTAELSEERILKLIDGAAK